MKTALIMEGGAMRGMFTCGVMDVLMENGITFDGAAGISAGACFGCNFKSGQIGRPIRYNKEYCRDPRYCSFRSLILTGDLYNADFCYRELPEVLDPFDREAFAKNPMAFYVGATDVETGECVFHRCTDGSGEDMLWFRASASMPVVSRPVRIGDRVEADTVLCVLHARTEADADRAEAAVRAAVEIGPDPCDRPPCFYAVVTKEGTKILKEKA